MSKPLRLGIHELVVNYLQTKLASGDQIDVAELTQEIAQSVVDVIMEQEEGGQGAVRLRPHKLGGGNLQQRGVFDQIQKGIKSRGLQVRSITLLGIYSVASAQVTAIYSKTC